MEELDDNEELSLVIPLRLKAAIADALNLHGHLENLAVELLWTLNSPSEKAMKSIANNTPNRNFAALREAIEARGGPVPDGMWNTLAQLRKDRNLIAHGHWSVVRGNEPHVVWRQFEMGNAETAVAVGYPYERFAWFMRNAIQFVRMFADLKRHLDDDMSS